MENKIVCDCEITKKTFEDKETGKVVPYYDFNIVINGQRIRVKAVTESKQLANYLLSTIITD